MTIYLTFKVQIAKHTHTFIGVGNTDVWSEELEEADGASLVLLDYSDSPDQDLVILREKLPTILQNSSGLRRGDRGGTGAQR